MSNTSLRFRFAVLHLKGDWSEWAHTFGFPSWSDHMFPCPFVPREGNNLAMFSWA